MWVERCAKTALYQPYAYGLGVAAQAEPVIATEALRVKVCPPCVAVTVKFAAGHFGSVDPACGVPLTVPVLALPDNQLGKLPNDHVIGEAGLELTAENVYE